MKNLRIDDEVWPELFQSAEWYEYQKRGLGGEVFDALTLTIEKIEKDPLLFPVVKKPIRRAQSHRFPFGVFFVIEDETIYIICIMHLSRTPAKWQRSGRAPES